MESRCSYVGKSRFCGVEGSRSKITQLCTKRFHRERMVDCGNFGGETFLLKDHLHTLFPKSGDFSFRKISGCAKTRIPMTPKCLKTCV